ncbi:MAG: lactate racemase domain-containing protein [Thermodesulfobacteriota bacterium]
MNFSHDPYAQENVIIGKTHRGTLVKVNRHTAFADLIIGIGECMPHSVSGNGNGIRVFGSPLFSHRFQNLQTR